MKELNHIDMWRGEYRGVSFTIKRFTMEGLPGYSESHNAWAHYIALSENHVPEDVRDQVFLPRIDTEKPWGWYRYSEGMLADLSWHGGITHYSYMVDVPGHRVIEAGCDYSHSWDADAGYPYDVDYVRREAEMTINSLHEAIPNLLRRCGWNGKYYPISEMVEWGDGMISKEGEAARGAKTPIAIPAKGET